MRAGAADGRSLESLTGRELEIGRLIVDRKTNREIAAELFLGQKTVEGPGDATAGDIRVFGHDAIHDDAEARLAVGLAPRATQTLNVGW